MSTKVNIKRNIKLFYLLVFMFEIGRSSFYGISSLFMLDTLKLALHQIALIKMFNPISVAVFELPSGIFGDRYGRKASFIISAISCAIGFAIYAFAKTFWHAVLGEIFYSIGLAFQTGSIDSLLISQANESKENISIPSMLSKSHSFRTLGLLIGGATGIFLSYTNMYYSWIFGSIAMIIVSLMAIMLDGKSSYKKESWSISELFFNFKSYLNNRAIVSLTILSIGIAIINIPFFSYWQIFMDKSLGISRRSISFVLIYIIYNLLMSIGSISLIFFNKILKGKTLTFSSYIIAFTTILMVLSPYKYLAILSFLVSEFFRGLQYPSFNFEFNRLVPDKERSIYNSKLSLFMKLATIASYLISGFLAKANGNIANNITYMSIFGLLLIFISTIMFNNNKVTK